MGYLTREDSFERKLRRYRRRQTDLSHHHSIYRADLTARHLRTLLSGLEHLREGAHSQNFASSGMQSVAPRPLQSQSGVGGKPLLRDGVGLLPRGHAYLRPFATQRLRRVVRPACQDDSGYRCKRRRTSIL